MKNNIKKTNPIKNANADRNVDDQYSYIREGKINYYNKYYL